MITCLAEGDTPFPVGEDILRLHPFLVYHAPSERTGEERRPFIFGSKRGRAVHTGGNREEVAPHEGVVDTGEVRFQRLDRLGALQHRLVQCQCHIRILGEVVWKIGSGHGLVFSPSAFESDTEHRIDAMSLVELMIEGEQGLGSKRFPNRGRFARFAVIGCFAFLRMAVVVCRAMPVVIAKTEVLAQLEPRPDSKLQERRREPRYLFEFVFSTIDIVERISRQPVQFIQLLSLGMGSISRREDKR